MYKDDEDESLFICVIIRHVQGTVGPLPAVCYTGSYSSNTQIPLSECTGANERDIVCLILSSRAH